VSESTADLGGAPGRVPGTAARRCPRCWSERLQPVETPGGTNLLCISCRRCWQLDSGYLVEVNRYACSGCTDPSLCRGG
jgi:hypothetical protein